MLSPEQLEALRKQAAAMAAARHEPTLRFHIKKASDLGDLWNDARCQLEVDYLLQDLLKPNVPEMFAIHEAGHEIYYRKAGFLYFDYFSPRIAYDEKLENPFNFQRARIKPHPEWIQPEGDWLRKLARGYAAGGRCSFELSEWKIPADGSDRCEWGKMYASRFPDMERDEAMEKDIEAMWVDAQADVTNDLRNEDSKKEIQSKAREIMLDLYPWLRV